MGSISNKYNMVKCSTVFSNYYNKYFFKYKLRDANDNIPSFNLDGYNGWIKVVNVYDGDTFRACVYKHNKVLKFTFRPLGYDAPEMKPRLNIDNREIHIEKAKEARKLFMSYLNYDENPKETKTTVHLENTKKIDNYNNGFVYAKCGKNDKYGRTLVLLYDNEYTPLSINDKMLGSGLVLAYDGKTKSDFAFKV